MNSHSKIRVAIVGGGIGGLTLAVALSRFDTGSFIQVDIYEAASKLAEVGAGLIFWLRAWGIIKDLGLEDDFVAHMNPGQELPSKLLPKRPFILKKGDQKEGIQLPDLIFRGGSIVFHRADVQIVLVKNISPTTKIHLNSRLVSFEEKQGGIDLCFKNGETATCDLLVGADGVHSTVRKGLLAKLYGLDEKEATLQARPIWTGAYLYRGIIDREVIRRQAPDHPCLDSPMVYMGKSKHLVTYPISGGKLINVAAFSSETNKNVIFIDGPTVEATTTDDIISQYSRWSEEVQCITKNLNKPMKWAVETVRPLEKFAQGRVFLLGDSAHAMTPHLGSGAGQAIEDGYILAQVLCKALQKDTIDISRIAEIYNTIRTPFANFVVEASKNQGLMYDLEFPGLEDVKEGDALSVERLADLWKEIQKGSRWTWDSSVGSDLKQALDMV